MAQPNVAREPSMEEILASIRRIIENNDPVESIDSAPYSAPKQSGSETIELTIDEDIATLSGDADFTPASVAPVQPAESVATPRAAEKMEQPAARPMSLADVAARVKAASERRQPAAPANDTEPQAQVADPSAQVGPVEAIHSEFQPSQALASLNIADAYRQPSEDYSVMSQSAASVVTPEVAHYSDPEAQAPTYEIEEQSAMDRFDASKEPVESALEGSEEMNLDPIERFAVQIGNEIASAMPAQLLSPMTEEKVSRSFEELADAIGGSQRSLDEIAEDMLKPMLQDWLDDNLPTLVERLVREEIERVARGPRR